jgi:hypothetical protein
MICIGEWCYAPYYTIGTKEYLENYGKDIDPLQALLKMQPENVRIYFGNLLTQSSLSLLIACFIGLMVKHYKIKFVSTKWHQIILYELKKAYKQTIFYDFIEYVTKKL